MLALERQKKILEFLNADGVVSVNRLSSTLGVTEETVRRDLEKLEKQESLRRTHGGAVSVEGSTHEFSLEKRKTINVVAKQMIAKEAAKMVVDGDAIFLDASTTTFFMAKELKTRKNVTVITNSLRVVAELSGCEHIKVIMIGGVMSRNQSFVGRLAEKSIEEDYFANKMFFSSKGIKADAGILESNESESGIKQRMFENSNKKYYLCDNGKIGGVGFVKLASFEEIDCLITNADLDEKLLEKLAENEVDVIRVTE